MHSDGLTVKIRLKSKNNITLFSTATTLFRIAQLPDIATTDLLMEIIDDLVNGKTSLSKDVLLERVATMSCKAAVKGNNELPLEQAHELLKELMSLENPYNCPHGRPTMIRMSKYEIEKKFKRIV